MNSIASSCSPRRSRKYQKMRKNKYAFWNCREGLFCNCQERRKVIPIPSRCPFLLCWLCVLSQGFHMSQFSSSSHFECGHMKSVYTKSPNTQRSQIHENVEITVFWLFDLRFFVEGEPVCSDSDLALVGLLTNTFSLTVFALFFGRRRRLRFAFGDFGLHQLFHFGHVPPEFEDEFLMMTAALLGIPALQQRGQFPEHFGRPPRELGLEKLGIVFQKFEINLILFARPGTRSDVLFVDRSAPMHISVNDIVLVLCVFSNHFCYHCSCFLCDRPNVFTVL